MAVVQRGVSCKVAVRAASATRGAHRAASLPRAAAREAARSSEEAPAVLQRVLGERRAALAVAVAESALRDAWPSLQALVTPWLQPAPEALTDTVPPRALGDADSRFTHLLGVEVHWKLVSHNSDDDTAPLLLCLHGFNGSTCSFDAVLGTMGAPREAAYDRPPFGLTARDEPSFRLSDEAGGAALGAALVDALHPRGVLLLGHSAGAAVALRVARALPPALLAGVVLVSPAVPASNTAEDSFLSRADLGQLLRLAATRALLATDGPGLRYVRESTLARAAAVRASLRIGYGSDRQATPAAVETYLRPLQALNWDKAILAQLRSFTAASPPDAESLRDVPVLIVQGGDDDIVGKAGVQRLAASLRAAGVEVDYSELAGVGHLPMEEAPEQFSAVVAPFARAALERHARRGAAVGGRAASVRGGEATAAR